jgi:HEAT repeat protein
VQSVQGAAAIRRERQETGPGAPSREKQEVNEKLWSVVEMLASRENRTVQQAYQYLSKNFSYARPLLYRAINHENPRVRRLSLKLLGEDGTAAVDLREIARGLKDPEDSVRLAAIMAVRALGPEGMPYMVWCLEREREPNLRKMVARTFYFWEDFRAVAPLADRLGREPNRGVRNYIVVALESLTKQKLGQDAEAWSAYLLEERRRQEAERIVRSRSEDEKKSNKRSGVSGAGE